MNPVLFLAIALAISAAGSVVLWLVLRERHHVTDAMTDFQRTMSALNPDGSPVVRSPGDRLGARRSGEQTGHERTSH